MPNKYTKCPSLELQTWMKQAHKCQQGQYDALGDRDWDHIDIEKHLEPKIGFALYGMTFISKNDQEQIKHVNNIKKHIIKLWDKIEVPKQYSDKSKVFFSSVFISLRLFDNDGHTKNEGLDVLFKIRKVFSNDSRRSKSFFIDRTCRTYDGIDDFLKNNKLPKCDICYPCDGVYSAFNGSVEVDFAESPACSISKKVLIGLDITSSVVAVGATAVSLAALAVPVAAPVVWGAVGSLVGAVTYDASRSVVKLIDINDHHENLGLDNPEARGAWIGLATSTVGVVSVGATALASRVVAETGVIGRNALIALRSLNISSAVITGVGVVDSLITVVFKFINKTLTKSDLLGFTNACLFFLNAVVSINLAHDLIREIASIDFVCLFNGARSCAYSFIKSAIAFTDSSSYNALRSLVFGKNSVLMPSIDIKYIHKTITEGFSLVDRLYNGSIGWEKFCMEISKISNNWYQKKECILEAIKKLINLFKINWSSYKMKNGYQPLANRPDIARKFCLIISETVDHIHLNEEAPVVAKDILSLIEDFIKCGHDISDFFGCSKFICGKFIKHFDDIKRDGESLNRNYDNLRCFKETIRKLNTTERLKSLHSLYLKEVKETVPTVNPCMEMDERVQYEVFSGPPDQKALKDEEYLKIVYDFTGYHFNENNSVILTQDGIVVIQPDKDPGIKAVIFYSSYELNCVMGVMTVMKN